MMNEQTGSVAAILGPTNTGKTREAIARMLRHRTGMIGLPLRLLAREVYDKVRAEKGNAVVGLVTGEERILPPTVRYWICTTEAMPVGNGVDFLAVDEIQLCADSERGHVFTDRLLHARGRLATLFLGAKTIAPIIRDMVPEIRIDQHQRLSRLTYSGRARIARMRPRTAIVAFTIEDVYMIADAVRRHCGGAAVVMGGLSPKTRNAQVDIYQNGDVDYLVATDAIGMGLNLDIRHVAFAGQVKFDGRTVRALLPAELAQIAGRAGRHRTNGTFGVTHECQELNRHVVESIEGNRFETISRLQWRNSALDFRSITFLLRSLDKASPHRRLIKVRQPADHRVLETLAEINDVTKRTTTPDDVRLLWEVCQLPDFRKFSASSHADLIRHIYIFLKDNDCIPDEWLAARVDSLAKTAGDIDALAMSLAYIRTWAYVAYRSNWVEDTSYWRQRARDVEDRLSDELHKRLTRRFVDSGTSLLVKCLKQGDDLEADMTENGLLTLEGQELGHFQGFRFIRRQGSTPEEERALKAASAQLVGKEFAARAIRIAAAPDGDLQFGHDGCIHWDGHPVGKLTVGQDSLRPGIMLLIDDDADTAVKDRVELRITAYVEHMISLHLGPLLALREDQELSAPARGLAFRLAESFGILNRRTVADDIKEIDADCRTELRKHGVKIAQHSIFLHPVLKPKATQLRLLLWSLKAGHDALPPAPPPGLTTVSVDRAMPQGYYPICGFVRIGGLAVRADILDRLMMMLWGLESQADFEASAEMLSITGTTHDDFAKVMRGLGYTAKRRERSRVEQSVEDEPSPKIEAVAPLAGTPKPAHGETSPVASGPSAGGASQSEESGSADPALEDEGQPPTMPVSAGPADPASALDDEEAAEETAEDAIEAYYVYTRRPRQKDRQSNRQPNRSKLAGGMDRSARGQRKKPARGRKVRRDRELYVAPPARPGKASQPDPDSPFAALKSLRDEL